MKKLVIFILIISLLSIAMVSAKSIVPYDTDSEFDDPIYDVQKDVDDRIDTYFADEKDAYEYQDHKYDERKEEVDQLRDKYDHQDDHDFDDEYDEYYRNSNYEHHEYDHDTHRDQKYEEKRKERDELREEHYPHEYQQYDLDIEEYVVEMILSASQYDEAQEDELCEDPQQIADELYDFVFTEISSVDQICEKMQNDVEFCYEDVEEQCQERISQYNDNSDPLRSSCPPDRDALVEDCIEVSREAVGDGDTHCEEDWDHNHERYLEICDEIDYECNEDSYLDSCTQDLEEELERVANDFDEQIAQFEEFGARCGNEVCEESESCDTCPLDCACEDGVEPESEKAYLETIEYLEEQKEQSLEELKERMHNSCKESWQQDNHRCEEQRAHCSKDAYVQLCISRANPGKSSEEIRRQSCEAYADEEVTGIMRMCAAQENHQRECFDRESRQCYEISHKVTECKEQLTSKEQLRSWINDQVQSECNRQTIQSGELEDTHEIVRKFVELVQSEDVNLDEVAQTLGALSKTVDNADELEAKEDDRTFWYKVRRIFKLLDEQEEQTEAQEYEQLRRNIADLETRINELQQILLQITDPDVKSRLNEQIEALEIQKNRLTNYAEKKAAFSS